MFPAVYACIVFVYRHTRGELSGAYGAFEKKVEVQFLHAELLACNKMYLTVSCIKSFTRKLVLTCFTSC